MRIFGFGTRVKSYAVAPRAVWAPGGRIEVYGWTVRPAIDQGERITMALAIVTGSAGLIGSETVRFLGDAVFDIIGIDNDRRRRFFGQEASTSWNRQELLRAYPERYRHHD